MTAIRIEPCRDGPGELRRHAALEALGDATEWIFATWREWRQRNRDRAELATLDERTLADIGLSRGEAEFLINKPFWRQ
jgi:uncharacterized protein YjiS (DUF1127 family)